MGLQILPFYLVCDESYSMEGEPIDAINQALPELHHEISANPVVADKTQFAIIGFSDVANVLQPLVDLSQVTTLPNLTPQAGTSYSAAFKCLKSEIESDVARLKAQGHKVYRPVAFFLSDGYPNRDDDWQTAHEEVVSATFPYHPNIVAFGFGSADKSVISEVATFRAFLADGTVSPAQALQEFATALTKSMVLSASSPGDGLSPMVPETVPGFAQLPTDEL